MYEAEENLFDKGMKAVGVALGVAIGNALGAGKHQVHKSIRQAKKMKKYECPSCGKTCTQRSLF